MNEICFFLFFHFSNNNPIIQMSEGERKSCYQYCNERFTAIQPERLFCKKGCDSDEPKIDLCKFETCNKLCIKTDQGQKKLWFRFLYRAPQNPDDCLNACIYGCIKKDQYQA